MKKLIAMLLALVMVMGLAACGGRGETPSEPEAGNGGFEAGATIGVSLPWLGPQNWKEAEEMFKTELEAAGFKPIIQAADQKVPQQQQQIESMI